MPNYRRARVPGGTYFFTLVTDRRRDLFTRQIARILLGDCFRKCQERWPFHINAIVLLPDHLHAIWTLPPGDADYSTRWSWLKKEFTKRWIAGGQAETVVSPGRQREGRRGVWQPRFWEHAIDDDDDFERHFDYLHYNPVKHGYVRCPHEWPHSSFHRWVDAGVYAREWACGDTLNFGDLDRTVGE